MLKKLSLLIVLFAVSFNLKAQRKPKETVVNISMNSFYTDTLSDLQALTKKETDNAWYKAFVPLKNLPGGFDSVSFVSNYLDYDQVLYQAYKRGDVPAAQINALIKKWGVDTLKCTPVTITADIRGMIGKKDGDWFYILDEDGNGDLKNETPVKLQRYGNKLVSNKQHVIKYQRYIDDNIKTYTTLIKVTDVQKANNEYRRLYYKYLEGKKGDFIFNGKRYSVNLTAKFNSFNYLEKEAIIIKEKKSGTSAGPFKRGDYLKLDGKTLHIEAIKKDGGLVTLVQKPTNKTYQSLQKGFLAPLFTGVTLNNDTVKLKDLRGAYTLIYFWNSSCAASTQILESNFEPFVAAINNAKTKLNILGVALDYRENIASFIKDKKIKWPQIIASGTDSIKDQYRITGFPSLFLIDPDGNIVETASEGFLNDFESIISRHLKW